MIDINLVNGICNELGCLLPDFSDVIENYRKQKIERLKQEFKESRSKMLEEMEKNSLLLQSEVQNRMLINGLAELSEKYMG